MIQQLDESPIQEREEVVKEIALRSFFIVVGNAVLSEQISPSSTAEAVAPDPTKLVLPQDRGHLLRGLDWAERRSPFDNAADDASIALPPGDRQGEAVATTPTRRVYKGEVRLARGVRQHRTPLHCGGRDGFGADIGL